MNTKPNNNGDNMFISLLFALFLSGCDSSEESIKYYNSNPAATITSHRDEDEILEGVEYTFVGMVSDDNHSSTELSRGARTSVNFARRPNQMWKK